MINLSLITPELFLAISAFVVLVGDLFLPRESKRALAAITALVLVLAVVISVSGSDIQGFLYNGMVIVDDYTTFFRILFPLMSLSVVLMSVDFVHQRLRYPGEYYSLILFATLAMIGMAEAGEIITAYISLELLNFCLYVLVSYARDNPKSNEAGLKYIILSAFASALLLYGFSFLYGIAGTTSYVGIAQALETLITTNGLSGGLVMALVLITAGLGFKVAAVPFHMWTPDVYEGAPIPVTALISVASKAAGFALLLRFFSGALAPVAAEWGIVVAVIAVVSMTIGNLVAIQQHNMMRLLAYSSISQVGYLLIGLVALNSFTASAVLLHVAGYGASNLVAFMCATAYFNLTGKDEISDYAGLAERAPFLALSMTIALFSLAGLPFFAGFVTKFYLFTAAANSGLLWLVAIAVTNSLISLYYYIQVVRQMYISQPQDMSRLPMPALTVGTLIVLLAAVILIGVYPAPVVTAVEGAVRVLGLS
ncbi:MAG: NADH-quinone oxidoreductase subunit N [Dehalococcoidia bacterium]|nr:NADH-quinone oxidoreductase subunit N [Dehalococcoidia bacterium]